jgi:hypothetical protein
MRFLAASPWLVVYLLVWLACGIAYKRIADYSHGDDFVFAGDLKTSSLVAAFKEKSGSRVNDGVVKAVVDGHVVDRQCQLVPLFAMDAPRASGVTPSCNRPMGFEWAYYYFERTLGHGYTSFAVLGVQKASLPEEISREKMYSVLRWGQGRMVERLAQLPGSDPEELKDCCLKGELSLRGPKLRRQRIILLLTQAPAVVRGKISEENSAISSVFIRSLTFPDIDYDTLRQAMDASYYSLPDFLYFSGITITTTGFGDIVPNATAVRMLVMAEAFLGIILLSGFLATLLRS